MLVVQRSNYIHRLQLSSLKSTRVDAPDAETLLTLYTYTLYPMQSFMYILQPYPPCQFHPFFTSIILCVCQNRILNRLFCFIATVAMD